MKKKTKKSNVLLPVWHDKIGLDENGQTKIIYNSRVDFQTTLHKVREVNFKPVY